MGIWSNDEENYVSRFLPVVTKGRHAEREETMELPVKQEERPPGDRDGGVSASAGDGRSTLRRQDERGETRP